jgi:hypothetical protein
LPLGILGRALNANGNKTNPAKSILKEAT